MQIKMLESFKPMDCDTSQLLFSSFFYEYMYGRLLSKLLQRILNTFDRSRWISSHICEQGLSEERSKT